MMVSSFLNCKLTKLQSGLTSVCIMENTSSFKGVLSEFSNELFFFSVFIINLVSLPVWRSK